ncbi:OmpA family protein [Acetobacter estunensis]|uniref:OmpA family protein n=1 Tax=Acetobacter estunensis TaxID=104097 RepID=UPI001C2D4603|nr:OmpA family protein [Acetobacter estunensis]MBV1837980.1 hypothetical protein [Acetobacter estunensis]
MKDDHFRSIFPLVLGPVSQMRLLMLLRERHAFRLSAFPLACIWCFVLAVPLAHAQVSTDTSALDALGPVPAKKSGARQTASPTRPKASSVARTGTKHVEHAAPAKVAPVSEKAPAAPATASGTKPASPSHAPVAATIPPAPPPPPVFTAPQIPVQLHPFPLPPDPQPVADAKGDSRPIDGGVRVTFAADSDHLNTETRNAILAFAKALKERPDTRALVDTTASGVPNDPSRPRRMALSRGLVVRAVLMNAGIPSTRIYVRVIGLPDKTGIETPADRADIRRSDAVDQ